MAERLPEGSVTFERGPRTTDFPEEWLDGGIWRLVRGEDFECTPQSFHVRALRRAERRGLKLRAHKDGDIVVIQAYAKENGE